MAGGDDNARELSKREEKLFNKKANLDVLNQELALNFYPERADFTVERALGAEFAVDLYDSEPMRCRRDLGNARASMLRPRGQEWFKAGSADEDLGDNTRLAKFFGRLNKLARTRLYHAASGFVRAAKEADHDVVTFGNGIQTAEHEIGPDGKPLMINRCWHPRDMVWLDDANGIGQDFAGRRFNASARHIRRKFPEAKLADNIEAALRDDPDHEFPLCHVMMRADEYDYYKRPKGRKTPWVSVYYDRTHKTLLRERPSQRFRYVIERWGTISGSQYGFSPAALTALPDARGIQTMAMVLLEAGEKQLDPPLKATKTAVKGQIDQSAGAITWVDDKYDEKMGAAIEPLLPHDLDPAIGIDLIARTTQALRDTWYLTKLTLPQQAKTAYETAQLVEEFIRANIPLFEPWEAGIETLLSEIFGVLLDMGAFGMLSDWPPELSGQALEFTFSNPLQDAIERNKVNQAQTVLGLIAGASKVNPAGPGASRIDVDEMIEDAARGAGSPADWIKDEQQLAADAARAQAGQNQGDILGALHGAGQAADVVNSGLDAAAKLRDLTTPSVDNQVAYGPT